jgi:hypothetical protein
MNITEWIASVRHRLGPVFSRPQVLACTSLSEVLPLDLMVLQVQVAGWGWLDIRSPQGFVLREFFREAATLQVAVPVRAVLTLKVVNPWGSRSYAIDTQTVRDEIWRAPEQAFRVRLPDDLQAAYDRFGAPRDSRLPRAVLPTLRTPVSLATRVPPFKLRASPAGLSTPDLVMRTLPAINPPLAAPPHPALPLWNAQLPMTTLESRMAQARIEP